MGNILKCTNWKKGRKEKNKSTQALIEETDGRPDER